MMTDMTRDTAGGLDASQPDARDHAEMTVSRVSHPLLSVTDQDVRSLDRDALERMVEKAARDARMSSDPSAFTRIMTDALATALAPVIQGRQDLLDKIDGLESDLDGAVEVAIGRGAVEWGRLNYPRHPALRRAPTKAV